MSDLLGVVAKRVAAGALTVLLLLSGVFFLMRVIGDPVSMLAGADPTEETMAAIRANLGLDLPLYQQYINFLADLIRGDLGVSYRSNRPATEMVLERLPATLQLAGVALGLAIVTAIPIGVISAVRPGSLVDSVARVVAVLGQSMPVFWLAILMILVFAVYLGWLPAGGRGDFSHLILPGLALSVYSVPLTMRITRSALLEVLTKDYMRTARAKGLREWEIIVKHGLRNAMIPVITVLALRIGAVISGAIVLEQVFAYPGLGRLGIQALESADFPVIQAFIVFIAVSTVLINLFADVLYTVVDPRVKIR